MGRHSSELHMDNDNEHAIAEGLSSGDRQAWLQFYDLFAERIWRGVARLMGDDVASVPDIVQETFLAAAESARSYDPRRGPLWPWLWSIARHRVAAHYRRNSRAEQIVRARKWWRSLNGEKTEWITSGSDAPPRILESRELADLVRATLAELPADYQALLIGRYFEGLSAEQLAKDSSCSGSSVRSKLSRARQAFHQAFMGLTEQTKPE